MRKILFIFTVLTFSLHAIASDPFNASSQGKLKAGTYKPGVIIIKMKPETRAACTPASIAVKSLSQKLTLLGASDVRKMFERTEAPAQQRNSSGQQFVDLSLIYKITYPGATRMEDALALLRMDENIAYAEPEYINYTCFTPNEPSGNLNNQYFLNKIQAYAAWDVWQGDTNTVVGIIDSGTDPDHPDLVNNIKYNYADPIDGADNDGDGYIDNFRGYDVSDHDNDPTVGVSNHGSHVSGCAAASTNNGIGVASPGFKCKFLPVKSTRNSSGSSIDNGYDGIKYAADHGVHVINLSWGRSGGFSQFEQDAINYAAINKNITIVAAAGNNGVDELFYPTSYENVLSVAATDNNDIKVGFSNYNFSVDVCAPGVSIYSTVHNNGYTYMDGTSMASPIAAGCAAMIKSKFPAYSAEQVAQQLRNTSDNIYGVNSGFANKLGKGRINLYKAVTDVTSPGVTVKIANMTDGNDNAFVINDTIRIVGLFKNLLAPSSAGLTCTLTASSNQVTVVTNSFTIGALNTLDTISNFAAPFRVRIKATAPLNLVVPMKLTMTDGTWTDFYSFNVTVNVDYINVEVNDISTTITSKGRIGYNVAGQSQGLGFKYKGGANNLYEMGLMIGDGVHQVSDPVRNDGTANAGTDEDFASVIKVARLPNALADFYSYGQFNEGGTTTTNMMNILVSHNTYAWSTNPDRKYVIVEYIVKNTGTSTLSDVFAGLFADWDIPAYGNNKGREDAGRKLGYIYSTDAGGLYCGMKLLSHGAGFKHYSIDNTAGGNGGINLYDAGFSNSEKYISLSTNRPAAGDSLTTGNDVINVVSSGSFTIAANDSFTVAFALIAGENLASIQASADAAQIRYDGLYAGLVELPAVSIPFTIYPNPSGKNTSFKFSLSQSSQVELSIYNILGVKVKALLNKKLNAGSYSYYNDVSDLPGGTYLIELRTEERTESQKILIVR